MKTMNEYMQIKDGSDSQTGTAKKKYRQDYNADVISKHDNTQCTDGSNSAVNMVRQVYQKDGEVFITSGKNTVQFYSTERTKIGARNMLWKIENRI